MPRAGHLTLLCAMAVFSSCATFTFPPGQATTQLERLARPAYPTFKGAGHVAVKSPKENFSGKILLALDGQRFRLEISDKAGRTIMAAAWTGTRFFTLNLSTGAKETPKGFISDLNPSIVRTLVTGAPPLYGAVKSARQSDGVKVATVSHPRMKITYTEKGLVKVSGRTGTNPYELSLGPMASGAKTTYVSSSTLEASGSTISIIWENVEQGVTFPQGFFLFEENLLGLEEM